MTLQLYRTGCRGPAVKRFARVRPVFSDIFPSGFATRPSHSAVLFLLFQPPGRNDRFSADGLGFAATSGVDDGAGYFVLEPKLHENVMIIIIITIMTAATAITTEWYVHETRNAYKRPANRTSHKIRFRRTVKLSWKQSDSSACVPNGREKKIGLFFVRSVMVFELFVLNKNFLISGFRLRLLVTVRQSRTRVSSFLIFPMHSCLWSCTPDLPE